MEIYGAVNNGTKACKSRISFIRDNVSNHRSESGSSSNPWPGFQEVVYQRALALELPRQGLEFSREVWIDIYYKGKKVGRKRIDFVVEEVMVELKAKAEIDELAFVQTLSYLKASGYKVGLLLNFGSKSLGIKRLVN